MNTKALQQQAVDQYEDLRDTILTLEAMKQDSGKVISWEAFKSEENA